MKKKYKVLLALVLLLPAVYGGSYWFFYRKKIFDTFIFSDPDKLSNSEKRLQKFYAPAFELDIRVNFERPVRKRLRGHWINADTGDFVTISKKDDCTFRLGEIEYSGRVRLERHVGGYQALFQHEGVDCSFRFGGDRSWFDKKPFARTHASVDKPREGLEAKVFYRTELTPAPD